MKRKSAKQLEKMPENELVAYKEELQDRHEKSWRQISKMPVAELLAYQKELDKELRRTREALVKATWKKISQMSESERVAYRKELDKISERAQEGLEKASMDLWKCDKKNIKILGLECFGEKKFKVWLKTPLKQLAGETPANAMKDPLTSGKVFLILAKRSIR